MIISLGEIFSTEWKSWQTGIPGRHTGRMFQEKLYYHTCCKGKPKQIHWWNSCK